MKSIPCILVAITMITGCQEDYKIQHLRVHSSPAPTPQSSQEQYYYPDVTNLDSGTKVYSGNICNGVGFEPELGTTYSVTVVKVPNALNAVCGSYGNVLMSIEEVNPDPAGTVYDLPNLKISRIAANEPWFRFANAYASNTVYCPDNLCAGFAAGESILLNSYVLEKTQIDGKPTLAVVLKR